MSLLTTQQCSPVSSESALLNDTEINHYLNEDLQQCWQLDRDTASISREFKFKDYYQTIAFVNAVAWIVHQQDHHPDMQVSYNRCHIHFTTHSINGLSINDFICAAKINQITVS